MTKARDAHPIGLTSDRAKSVSGLVNIRIVHTNDDQASKVRLLFGQCQRCGRMLPLFPEDASSASVWTNPNYKWRSGSVPEGHTYVAMATNNRQLMFGSSLHAVGDPVSDADPFWCGCPPLTVA